jgi:hypothetical protein
MRTDLMTGISVKAAALRGLVLGLVLQALLIGAIEIAGPPINPALAALSGPSGSETAVVALAQAHP